MTTTQEQVTTGVVEVARAQRLPLELPSPVEFRRPGRPGLVRMLIEPEIAQGLLDVPRTQRRLREDVAARYARDMAAGHWDEWMPPDPICLGNDLDILNGQHRLRAVVLSGRAVEFWVMTDCTREDVAKFDQPLVRKVFAQVEILDGVRIGPLHQAVLRAMYASVGTVYPNWTESEARDVWARRGEVVAWACDQFTASRVPGLKNAATVAVCARATYTVPRERVARFVAVLHGHSAHEPGEIGAVLLRNFLLSSGRGGGPEKALLRYGKSARALTAFLAGDQLVRLNAVASEPFPMPE
jgi:hypothetical protein